MLCLGEMDIKGLLRSVGLENIVKYVLSICEQGFNISEKFCLSFFIGLIKVAEATQELGKPLSTWSLLVDLEGNNEIFRNDRLDLLAYYITAFFLTTVWT